MVEHLRKLACRSNHAWARHAVIVTRGGAIIASGWNYNWRHAENNALSKLWPSERVGTVVWSIRVSKGGKLSMAKPCPNCMKLLVEAKVKRVIYSTDQGTLETMKIGKNFSKAA